VSRLADRLTGLDRTARATPGIGGLPSLGAGGGRGRRWNVVSVLVILLVIVVGMFITGGFWLAAPRSASVSGLSAPWTPAGPAGAREPSALPQAAPPGSLASPSLPASRGAADGQSQTLTTLRERGVALARAGALVEAAADFRHALAREPWRADLWNNLGVVLVRTGDLGAGVAAFRKAVALAPGDSETHRNLAVALDRRGQAAEAARHYRSFLDAAPSDHPERAAVDRRLAALKPRRDKP
jgi:hypothetical protein